MKFLAAVFAASLLVMPSGVASQTVSRGGEIAIPATPAPVKGILYARPFTLETPYKNTWSKERATVSTGVLIVLEVDPALVVPRNALEPVLYAGNVTVQRQHFEQNYLTAARLKRVRMAAALLRSVDQYSTDAEVAVAPAAEHTSTSWLRDFWGRQAWSARAVAAFAVVIIVVGAWWLFIPRTTGPDQAEARMPYATLVLSISNGDRAEGARRGRVKLTPEAGALKIVLTLPEATGETGEYRAQLENVRGEIKFSKRVSQLDARSISVLIPVEQLAHGEYAVTLFAIKTDGSEQRVEGNYLFNVE